MGVACIGAIMISQTNSLMINNMTLEMEAPKPFVCRSLPCVGQQMKEDLAAPAALKIATRGHRREKCIIFKTIYVAGCLKLGRIVFLNEDVIPTGSTEILDKHDETGESQERSRATAGSGKVSAAGYAARGKL